jgi:hypothetical protein
LPLVLRKFFGVNVTVIEVPVSPTVKLDGVMLPAVILSGWRFASVALVCVALVTPAELAKLEEIPLTGVSELGFLKLYIWTVSLFKDCVVERVMVTMFA